MAGWPYNTSTWRKVRAIVLLRDGRWCQLQLPGCIGTASAVHHIVPPAVGGHPFALDNLQAACSPCNLAERNARRAEWARKWAGEELGPEDVVMVKPW